MLRKLSIAFCLSLTCLIVGTAVAQANSSSDSQSPAAGEAQQHAWGHGPMSPEKRLEMMTKQLKLTSDQQPKVLDVLKAQQSQMEQLRSDNSLSQEDRRSKMMQIHKDSNDQIRALLDADQQKKWDKMQSEHGPWHQPGQNSAPPADSSEQK